MVCRERRNLDCGILDWIMGREKEMMEFGLYFWINGDVKC